MVEGRNEEHTCIVKTVKPPYRPPKLLLFVDHWLGGWVDVVCGLINVITFTLLRPSWDFEIRCAFAKYYAKKAKERADG